MENILKRHTEIPFWSYVRAHCNDTLPNYIKRHHARVPKAKNYPFHKDEREKHKPDITQHKWD